MNREEILSSLVGGTPDAQVELLAGLLEDQHPADIAAVLAELPAADVRRLLLTIPSGPRAELLGYFGAEMQTAVVGFLNRNELVDLIVHMSPDERVDLVNRLPEASRESLLPALAKAEREDIRKLASYPEGTVGAVMTSDYATLPPDATAREAVELLRAQAPDKETIYQAYVVDAGRRLMGTVSLRDLIVAAPHVTVRELMLEDVIFVNANDLREEAAGKVARYDLLALPVVNGGEKLVGIVTYDDAMDVAEEEATEDFHKASGHSASIGASMRDAPIGLLYRRRIVWLVVLVFGNLFSGAGIAYFEETIAAYVALVFFLPLLIDSGGNAGSQAATLMIRALATGDLYLRDWGRMLGREFAVAGLLGITMALAVSGIGVFRGGPDIALVVATTMIVVVIAGSVIGMSLPFILARLKLDPATASAPLITSIADATGVIIYFTIATMILAPMAA